MTRSLAASLALALCLACGRGDATPPAPAPEPEAVGAPNARPDIAEGLLEDRAAVRHPSDGGGRAWLEPGEDGALPEPVAGELARFHLVYEAGPRGVAEGGAIQLQVSPFWGWSTPQTFDPSAPGYTEVRTEAEGVELDAGTLDSQLLGIQVGGRDLAPGERVHVIYGAGEIGAQVDRFAEAASPFFFFVDGDGDGVRGLVPDWPRVRVRARAPARLLLHLPSVARPGESVRLRAAVVDASASAGVSASGTIRLDLPPGVQGPAALELVPESQGVASAELRVVEPGLVSVRAEGPGGLLAESNPLLVDADAPRVRWADLHGHSVLSDGTAIPEDWYRYARDVAALDVAALTDHDHWGLPFLDESSDVWRHIQQVTASFHAPGRFVTLVGYEWTSWIYGHRHVLHFDPADATGDVPLRSSLDEATDTPAELWAALRGQRALTFAHHSAGGPIATDWSVPPDPVLEPLTEVASVHGNSESESMPWPIRGGIRGNWVPDALGLGYRLGFVGSGDGHDGHPGLAHLAGGTGGLAAIFSEDLTREGVLAALRARRTYATNGPRILLLATVDGALGGSLLSAGRSHSLRVDVAGTGALRSVEIVADGELLARHGAEGRRTLSIEAEIGPFAPDSFVYVRVAQEDGGAAWSSPFFFVDAPPAEAPPAGSPPAGASPE